ncbi:hypothetical protein TWF594_007637 [Orbilia oligospora]|uniref:Uncharacterized protein n=1 Tax=Orbilia oligospora TaxID=2813651 RepID=A0A7C8JSZ4_ORBOL|nr:hypothetical protein TWF594_007637 [Orbilia oligospora]KAF3137246.1 hypothetical protein TWF703_005169 [Orbilia oligospora]
MEFNVFFSASSNLIRNVNLLEALSLIPPSSSLAPVNECHVLRKLYSWMANWDRRSIPHLVKVNNQFCEYFGNKPSPELQSQVHGLNGSDLCQADLPSLANIAGAAKSIGGILDPKILLIWTRLYLEVCCYLSDKLSIWVRDHSYPQYDDNGIICEVRSSISSILPPHTTPSPSIVKLLLVHKTQFLRPSDSPSWVCVLCSTHVSCRSFLCSQIPWFVKLRNVLILY